MSGTFCLCASHGDQLGFADFCCTSFWLVLILKPWERLSWQMSYCQRWGRTSTCYGNHLAGIATSLTNTANSEMPRECQACCVLASSISSRTPHRPLPNIRTLQHNICSTNGRNPWNIHCKYWPCLSEIYEPTLASRPVQLGEPWGTKRPEIPGHLWSDHWNTSAKSKMCKIIQDHHNKGEDEIKQKQLTASPILYGGIVCVSLSQGPQNQRKLGVTWLCPVYLLITYIVLVYWSRESQIECV